MLVTMESFHVLNSGFHTPMFKRDRPELPITIASAGETEHWVTVDDTTPGQVILDALSRATDHEDPALGFTSRVRSKDASTDAIRSSTRRGSPGRGSS